MWLYDQASGQLNHNSTFEGTGYSGHGPGINNPSMEQIHNIGPIPRGRWTIGPAFVHPLAGPVTMRLTPDASTDTFGRDGLMIHGDLPNDRREASEGCVVLARAIREQIAASEDRALVVI